MCAVVSWNLARGRTALGSGAYQTTARASCTVSMTDGDGCALCVLTAAGEMAKTFTPVVLGA